jgi:hypothetical protein
MTLKKRKSNRKRPLSRSPNEKDNINRTKKQHVNPTILDEDSDIEGKSDEQYDASPSDTEVIM